MCVNPSITCTLPNKGAEKRREMFYAVEWPVAGVGVQFGAQFCSWTACFYLILIS
jgi:hypothetical protein